MTHLCMCKKLVVTIMTIMIDSVHFMYVVSCSSYTAEKSLSNEQVEAIMDSNDAGIFAKNVH